ncbi:heterokaryon incompatibility protein-domain-containing protein [Lasiosphaeris hirsuta]|uniref:Heterokaryon incompatibility protein-domain-containing protein n=1 Tax=Lasiosphaeris hirsuta TaxID=260670 RepID=A0AA40AYC4_9PEZI|nr:heterokaryon incompatibility protein-domain-containing protein [Lasiosphaeris hirsuta]
MSSHFPPIPYPHLPANTDAIRILTVEPGDFLSPLVCTLTPAAFHDKPKYVALSYTWGNSHPSPVSPPKAQNKTPRIDSEPVSITVNDHAFGIAPNLHAALVHLRSPTHPLPIWADAVCINQHDAEERNQQVSLMSFIYSRAIHTVAWIGAKGLPSTNQPESRAMAAEWKSGRTQFLAEALTGGSLEKRHSDMMRLESLIERFAESKCSELRDRVFGLLDCANDIRPFVGQDEKADSLNDYIKSLGLGLKTQLRDLRRGMGALKVDYSRLFDGIWTNVVQFVYFQAKAAEAPVSVLDRTETLVHPITERHLSIVRTARHFAKCTRSESRGWDF